MSVVVTVRIPVADVAAAIEGLQGRGEFLGKISEIAKGSGMLHHRFVAGDGEIIALDEFETAEQFQSFFDANSEIADVMASIGMTGPPTVSVYQAFDAPGTL
jgi:hypothetical protein